MTTRDHLNTAGGLVVRIVLYAVGVGIAVAIGWLEWNVLGLEAVMNGGGLAAARMLRWHDRLPVALALATFLLAVLGSVSRMLSTLLLWALLAAIVTAPPFIAHALGMLGN